jgi:polysaccharide export outer membrane protein
MVKCKVPFILLVAFAAALLAGAQDDNRAPDQKLVRYIQDARKAGLQAPQIRQKAIEAGWEPASVEAGLAAVLSPPPDARASSATPTETAPPARTEPAPANPPAAAPEGAPPVKPAGEGVRGDDYVIGEGDVLQVAVWGEPAASVQSATVRPDGKISMPLIKDVTVAGLTPALVERNVQEQLAKVIRAPDVTVIVAQINSKKIFLTGAVKREGPLKFTYRMTVLQAISEAGGLTDYAKRKNIYILHTENGRQFRLPFDYTAVLKGEKMEQNILLSPGDTIVVP